MADADRVAGLHPVHGEQVVARLGEGLQPAGTLRADAMERALAAVRNYRDRARQLGAARVLVVATAAVRAADNREAFVARLAAEPDLTVRVIDGQDEARLALLGVAAGLAHPGEPAPYAVLDVGGGSTELITARGAHPLAAISVPLGVVALAERFFHADPVDWAEYATCADHVSAQLNEAWAELPAPPPRRLVGTAGTMTTLAALDLGLTDYDPSRVQGHRLTSAAIRRLLSRLGALALAERARLPCLEPGRADLIVPGIAVVLAALVRLGLDELTVSDSGLREGILLDAVGWTPAD